MTALEIHDRFPPRRYRCGLCLDIGWVELPPDASYTTEGGNEAKSSLRGAGAVRRCKGPQGKGCPFDKWKLSQRLERVALKSVGSGEGAGEGEEHYS